MSLRDGVLGKHEHKGVDIGYILPPFILVMSELVDTRLMIMAFLSAFTTGSMVFDQVDIDGTCKFPCGRVMCSSTKNVGACAADVRACLVNINPSRASCLMNEEKTNIGMSTGEMCVVEETVMACGHTLRHISSRCPFASTSTTTTPPTSTSFSSSSSSYYRGTLHPARHASPTTTSHGERTCARPEISERQWMHDTCAECDPERRRRVLRARYEQDLALLGRRYADARLDGDTVLMGELEWEICRLVSDVRAGNFEAGRPIWGGGGYERGGHKRRRRTELELDVEQSRNI